jgi:ferredoxin
VYRIEIDRSLCSGFGSCAEHAPHALSIGADGLASPTDGQIDDPSVIEAAAGCPMGAIAVYDDTGTQIA